MNLESTGKAGAPEVLLLSDAQALQMLGKHYCLLLPSYDEETTPEAQLAALEREIQLSHGGRIRGVFARDADTALALGLYLHGAVRVGVTVLEGEVVLPADAAAVHPGKVVYWHRKKDKTAKKTKEALKALARPLSTVTMKKLPKDSSLALMRPDMAVEQLGKVLGGGVTITCAGMLPGDMESVWRDLTLSPVGESALLERIEPILCEDDDHVQILEGSSKKLRMWSHMVRLERADDDLTFVTDQIELDAGKLNGLFTPVAGLYLRMEQFRRTQRLKKDRHALS